MCRTGKAITVIAAAAVANYSRVSCHVWRIAKQLLLLLVMPGLLRRYSAQACPSRPRTTHTYGCSA